MTVISTSSPGVNTAQVSDLVAEFGGTSASSSGTIAASTDNGYIGSYKGESAAQFKGSVYGFRSTIGTARYTSNFTPPTSDLTDDIAWDSSAETGVGFLKKIKREKLNTGFASEPMCYQKIIHVAQLDTYQILVHRNT